ncbi:MAG TPA: hypothetical protein VJ598_04270, partial [Albitalea sp.]|nr:hypothetical protein [Albitalea sp.]
VADLERHWSEAMGVPLQRFGKTQILKEGSRRPCDDRRATFGALEIRIRKRKQTNLVLGMYNAKRRYREQFGLLAARTSTTELFELAHQKHKRSAKPRISSPKAATLQPAGDD